MSRHSARIRELNDQCRRTLALAGNGHVVLTQGIVALGQDKVHNVITKIITFDAFTPDNDLYGEHDFGKIELDGERVYWKIDYYDASMVGLSEDPSDPAKTRRVLTIMLASEY